MWFWDLTSPPANIAPFSPLLIRCLVLNGLGPFFTCTIICIASPTDIYWSFSANNGLVAERLQRGHVSTGGPAGQSGEGAVQDGPEGLKQLPGLGEGQGLAPYSLRTGSELPKAQNDWPTSLNAFSPRAAPSSLIGGKCCDAESDALAEQYIEQGKGWPFGNGDIETMIDLIL